jgi:hypothetical protein
MDELVAQEIKSYDYVVIGSAEWGKNPFENTTYAQQSENFFRTIYNKRRANNQKFVYVYNKGYNRSTKSQYKYLTSHSRNNIKIFNMQRIKSEMYKKSVPGGHGFSGATTRGVAREVLSLLSSF